MGDVGDYYQVCLWVLIKFFSNDEQKIGITVSTQCKLNGLHVISLKFRGKSKKIGGVWTSRTSIFRKYDDPTHQIKHFQFFLTSFYLVFKHDS